MKIANSLAQNIVESLGGDWRGDQGNVPGFGNSKGDRRVSVCGHPNDPDDVLVHSFGRADALEFKAELRRRGLLPPRYHATRDWQGPISRPSPRERRLTEAQTRNREFARRIWDESAPALGTAAETYIQTARGIGCELPASLRFHPRCLRGKGELSLPALIAAITDPVSGEFLATHRIFLRPDGSGKADIPKEQQKMSLGPSGGGAVVLGDLFATDGPILEGEGVETTLTACWIMGLAGIATLSASTLGRPPLPPGWSVIILADRGADAAAERAAELRAGEGREVRIALPPDGCKDFNDAVRGA